LAVILDLRSDDGKIIARMDESGYVINRNNTLEIKKSKSNLTVVDIYGREVLDVKYLNPHAVSVRGENIGLPKGMTYVCTESSPRGTDIQIP
jgi:hypothetical protein